MSLLAVDMGSSSCKAVAFSSEGNILAQATQPYSAQSPHPLWSEMPPETFWRAFASSSNFIAEQVTNDPVEALAISSHGETFVPVDKQKKAVGNAILNADNRALVESRSVEAKIGRENLFRITGLAAHPMYPLPKILWVRKQQPDVFSSASQFVSLPGYLLSRLDLPPYVDDSLASRYLAFDIHHRTWSAEILSRCDLSPDLLPVPVPAGTIAGELSENAAAQLGLRRGTPVILGGHDQPCAALGNGVLGPGRVSASLGTYECLLAVSEKPALSETALAANLNSYCHVVPDRYITIAYFPSGIMVDWFARTFHPASTATASRDFLALMEEQATTDPTGLCITPHLLGTCNPDFDPNATGVIAGIRPTTTTPQIYRGILEGIACEFAGMANLLQEAAGTYRDVYASGGGQRSRLGLHLRASLSGHVLHLMQSQEAVCLGTAILAGVAIGKYASIAEAVTQVVRVSEEILPDPALATSYKGYKARYQLLYSSLASFRKVQEKQK